MSCSHTVTVALAALLLHCVEARAETPLGILLAAGDIAKCAHKNDEAVAAIIAKHVLEADKQKIPVHVLALGDLAYDHGSEHDFGCFDKSWGSLLKLKLENSDVKRLMLPVPGNHEYEQAGGLPYYSYFEKVGVPWVFQQEKEKKKQKADNKGYFSLRFPDPKIGPWQLFGLNSELTGSAKEAQLTWLEEELKASDPELKPPKPPCVLAFWHKPLFSSGTHGHGDCPPVKGKGKDKVKDKPCERTDAPLCRPDEQDQLYCGAMKTMTPFYQKLLTYGASVVLAGHDHHFEQFKLLDAMAKPDPKRGIRSFVVGTGGGSLYQKKRTYRWGDDVRDVYSHSSFGVLRIELFADRYQWRFVPIDKNPEISLKVGDTVVDSGNCIPRQ